MTFGSTLAAHRVFAEGGVEVLLARLDVGPQVVEVLATSLCEAEHLRAARLRHERHRRRFVAARAHLRALLAERLGVAPATVALEYGRHGKPALAAPHAASGWRFNLAHCGGFAVYAFARGFEVGVDLEEMRAFPEADAVAARFFSPRERRAYAALDAQLKPLGFYNCWTRKEAVVKAHGDGLGMPLGRFDVTLAPQEPAAVVRLDPSLGERADWRLESFTPLPGFIAAVASRP